ncbi:hypothetical protein, partial [Cupriavidus basilensis]|uniref:hypothetical protein n=1 Tax=Cupriavidus basilensis TaxID=68895 RepID=UPI0028437950
MLACQALRHRRTDPAFRPLRRRGRVAEVTACRSADLAACDAAMIGLGCLAQPDWRGRSLDGGRTVAPPLPDWPGARHRAAGAGKALGQFVAGRAARRTRRDSRTRKALHRRGR